MEQIGVFFVQQSAMEVMVNLKIEWQQYFMGTFSITKLPSPLPAHITALEISTNHSFISQLSIYSLQQNQRICPGTIYIEISSKIVLLPKMLYLSKKGSPLVFYSEGTGSAW